MIKKAMKALVPNPGTLIVLALFLWAQAVGAVPGKAPATQSTTIPRLISYQGRLTDAVGDPVANDNYHMVFSLYCTQTGGEAFWFEDRDATNKVPVSDGFFNILLGQLTSMPASFPCPDGNVYLGIRVDPDPTEMEPRELLASVPYAFQAVEVPDGSITTEKIADGAVTSAKLEHSGPHIPITPDENGLVKMAVMRQDITTDTHSNNQVILTGWGFATGDGSNTGLSKQITFGVTFSAAPVVIVSNLGTKAGSDPASIGELVTPSGNYHAFYAYNIVTTGFLSRIDQEVGAPIGSGVRVGFSWIAIGTLE